MSDKKSVWETLSVIDMGQHIKAVQNQRYIPWHNQWGELLKSYPEATYEVHENDIGDPYFVSTMGIFVKVSVTIEGLTRTINYPVLNSSNKSLKIDGYTYTTKRGQQKVEPCSSFDINTSIMRALTKVIALFGLGLYVYQDELTPEVELVGSTELQAIMDKIKEKNLVLKDICSAWQIEKPSQLYLANFEQFMTWLESA